MLFKINVLWPELWIKYVIGFQIEMLPKYKLTFWWYQKFSKEFTTHETNWKSHQAVTFISRILSSIIIIQKSPFMFEQKCRKKI